MDTLSYKTVSANRKTVAPEWHLVDAQNKIVGRLASEIAKVIRGKNKPYFTPHVNCGDKVVVVNAEKVRFTGKKMAQKEYIRYTGYPGGQRIATPKVVLSRHPERVLEMAVRNMLPHNRLRKEYMKNLFIYVGEAHPHQAQDPKPLAL